ncbi:MAG TPA: lipid-A-disaccharide synthase, partial [Bacteroidota bacterium]|nr:lipid-A-disaccharide synthase [Bacteroidota bacterium]
MLGQVVMVAGEASGDLHGAGVVKALRERVPGVKVSGIGGDNMRREGMELLHHISELSFMGFAEVARNLRTVLRVESELVTMLDRRRPDVV